jgi:hypothetical protein
MISRRQQLLWGALILVTGYTAPAYAQDLRGWGYGDCFARDYATIGCVFENTGHPFSGLYGFGDIHGTCTPQDHPPLYHHASYGETGCWWDAFHTTSTVFTFQTSQHWNPERHLIMGGISISEGYVPLGTYGEWISGGITWDQFTAGEPIEYTVRWDPSVDWLRFPYLATLEDPTYAFRQRFNMEPWEAQVRVRIDFLSPHVTIRNAFLFGTQAQVSAWVEPDECLADFDKDGQCAVPDIFAFLVAWFRGYARADWDGGGACGGEDIFAFLSSYFGER